MADYTVEISSTEGLKNLEKQFEAMVEKALDKMAEECKTDADTSYQMAYGNADDITTSVTMTVDSEKHHREVNAIGEEVAFVEFGTGVTYNSGSPYPVPRPEGIVGIGEYGYGMGKMPEWSYTREGTGETVTTQGIPASKSLINAFNRVEADLGKICDEVFK